MNLAWAEEIYNSCKNNPPPEVWDWIDDNGEAITNFGREMGWALSIGLVTEGWWHWDVLKRMSYKTVTWNPMLDENCKTVAHGSAFTEEAAKQFAEDACKTYYEIELNARRIQLEKAKAQ